ncbi:MAG: methyltransferase domain-containing protein, partial [Saprospiraceae bacterium]|nr:methyltransferase domain-containing protein [Saprospiraceae bacterium]
MFKKLLSYITDIHLESRESEHNEELHVVLSRGRHQLCTPNAIYSFDDLYDNYRNAFKKVDIGNRNYDTVLILGLGLGSIPYMLENLFNCFFHYTAVEIDEEVVELANKYCLSQLESHIETIVADAHEFILQNERQFDLVCMDVFVDDIIPAKFHRREFLTALKGSISPGGLLMYNRLARTPKDRRASRSFFEGHFKE